MPADQTAIELFDRSIATLVRSWAYFATGSPGAEVIEADGVGIAIFVHSPEREFLNNAVLTRGVADLGGVLDLIEHAYRDRGVESYAIWVHESEKTVAGEIEGRGYVYDSSTRTMAMPIADLGEADTSKLELVEPDLAEFHRAFGMPEGLFSELSWQGAHLYLARFNGEDAATLMAFDHEGDCGIYNVATVPTARRRGLGTALTVHALREARQRGCTTAGLQATEMAEGLYASIGFRDLGRFDEYVPAP
jgi:GNAT superfamily N-acetyltransferase